MIKLVRYKVVVLGIKPRKGEHVDDEGLFQQREDVFFGYSYPRNYVGKHFDLWFTRFREWDLNNFAGFGRIIRIDPAQNGDGHIYITRQGRFFVKELRHAPDLM